MTEAEKAKILDSVKAGMAFGGAEVTPEMLQVLYDRLDGKLFHEDLVEMMKSRYGA